MHSVRIIPRLDIKGPNLVKGVHLEGLRVLGKPEAFARHYYENGADELLYMDVVASLYGRNSLLPFVEKTSREVFIPLIVGGGLRTLEDIRTVLRAGADKVALNTAAVARPELVREASKRFGSSTIVVSIEAMRQPDGSYEVFTDNGRQRTGLDAHEWALQAADLGAGEIMLTSIDREGTGRGFDAELTSSVGSRLSIPVIACGGAGRIGDVVDVVKKGHADAVALASILHYGVLEEHRFDADFSAEGNTDFLNSRATFTRVQPSTLHELKVELSQSGIACRLVGGN